MENLLKKIIEMDEKAREQTRQAELDKIRSEQEIEELKTRIYNDYIDRAKERVEKNIAIDLEQAQAQRDAYAERIRIAEQELHQTYDQNADKWVDEIVTNVIG